MGLASPAYKRETYTPPPPATHPSSPTLSSGCFPVLISVAENYTPHSSRLGSPESFIDLILFKWEMVPALGAHVEEAQTRNKSCNYQF